MKKSLKLASFAMLFLGVLSCGTNDTVEDITESTNLRKPENENLSAKYTPEYTFLGSGYNVTKSFAVESSAGNQVVDVYQLTNAIETQQTSTQEYKENYGENAYEYSKSVTTKLDLGGTFSLFKQSITASFNGSLTQTNKFDGKYIYGSYHLLIKQKRYKFTIPATELKNYLKPQFVQDVQTFTPQQIVETYGTHVLTDIYTGGKLDVMFRSETSNENRTNASQVGVKVAVGNIFNINVNNNSDTSSSSKNFNRTLYYKSYGGDATQQLLGTLSLDQSNPTVSIANWQNSCTPQNSVFVDIAEHGVVKLYDLVEDPIKKASLKAYIDQYLIDNQVQMEFVPIQIHRYYNNSSTDHFYTKDTGSFSGSGYGYEGVAFLAYNYKAPGSVPVYRYWNGTDHYYSTSPGAPSGYSAEGIEFYAYPSQSNGSRPVYQYYGRKKGDHFYTTSQQNYANYTYEGIPFYAL
nr:MAC/perforin domain-containing protein [uncultured Chryseobacterium sp.]